MAQEMGGNKTIEGQVEVITDAAIDSLFVLKLAVDNKLYQSSYFTIQLFFGAYADALIVLDDFDKRFPHMKAKISFETPNYKIQTGSFKSKAEAVQQLAIFKRYFPSAFILSKR